MSWNYSGSEHENRMDTALADTRQAKQSSREEYAELTRVFMDSLKQTGSKEEKERRIADATYVVHDQQQQHWNKGWALSEILSEIPSDAFSHPMVFSDASEMTIGYENASDGMYQTTDALGQPPAGSRLLQYIQKQPPSPRAYGFGSDGTSSAPQQQQQPFVSTHSQTPGAYASSSQSGLNAQAPPFVQQQTDYNMQQAQMQMQNMNFYQESLVGGTTYFYNGSDNQMMSTDQTLSGQDYMPSGTNSLGGMNAVVEHPSASALAPADSLGIPVVPDFYLFPGTPPHLSRARPKGAALNTYFAPSDMKNELLNRQLMTLAQPDPTRADVPVEVECYRQLCPLDQRSPDAETPGYFLAHRSSVYKTQCAKDGLFYCLRRLHGYRLGNSKSLSVCDMWKKLVHSNVVLLRDVFATKAFGDFSVAFVYDYHPMAETLRTRHFNAQGTLLQQRINGLSDAGAKFATANGPSGASEPLIWSYIIQLSSALRAIHSAGLAARVVDPTKILIVGKSKLLLNGVGIMDTLTFDSHQANMQQAVQVWQNDDLYGLGRLIVALACGSLQSATRDALQQSILNIAHNYSADLKNIVAYLLQPGNPMQPGRNKSINEVMPMIGARFYAQLESVQMKNDQLESDLSKELENGRLFRLVSKLCTITDRPDYGARQSWSETGDRYLLKLFRGYVFHAVTAEGVPWIDMAHVVQCLNKLDAGVPERLQLMSPDGKNVLIVSYSDLRRCLQQAWTELTHTNGVVM